MVYQQSSLQIMDPNSFLRNFSYSKKIRVSNTALIAPTSPHQMKLLKEHTDLQKRILNKSMLSGQDPYNGLLEYHNTSMDEITAIALLLMRHQLQSVFPVTEQHLEKQLCLKISFWHIENIAEHTKKNIIIGLQKYH